MKKLLLSIILTVFFAQLSKAQTNPLCFNAPVNYPLSGAGAYTFGMTYGDFNGDGKNDLAVVSQNPNVLTILMNNGTGGFAAPVNYGVNGYPQSLKSADFNGDGKFDLLMPTSGNQLLVFFASSTGTFTAPAVSYGVGTNPERTVISDFNGDGKADFVVTNFSSSNISVLLGNGTGGFATPVNYNTYSGPDEIILADFNADGKADLAVTTARNISILLGNGNGTFAAANVVATFSVSNNYGLFAFGDIQAADFNGDSKIDLVVTTGSPDQLFLLRGDGTGGFAAPVIQSGTKVVASEIASKDFDGNGTVDIAIPNYYKNTVDVLLNTSTGTLTNSASFAANSYPQGLISADFDGDGRFDFASSGDGNIAILLNCLTNKPPGVSYPTLPANICVGSTINKAPAFSGGTAQLGFFADSTIAVSAPKAICKNDSNVFVLCEGDSILRYDFSGNYKQTYPWTWSNITSITADNQNRVYVVSPDINNSSISTVNRFLANGTGDFTYSFPSYVFGFITGIAFSPADGYVYIADTTTGYLNKLDTGTATITALAVQQNNAYSYYKPVGIAFGKNNDLYLVDKGLKQVLRRDAPTGNYYPVIPGLDTMNWNMTALDIDTNGEAINYFLSSGTGSYPVVQSQITNTSGTLNVDNENFSVLLHPRNPAGIVYADNGGTLPILWVANTGGNNVIRFSIFLYQISPPLPMGLHYDFVNGSITGTPQATAPPQTYTITTQNSSGTSTTTINFSIDPPGPVSNAVGTHTSAAVQSDGLSINYFDPTNCAPMLNIADSIGGSVVGSVIATQTVYPTIATFNADTFIARVTNINAQNPDANANISLYFTYLDIVHFNQVTPAASHLSNDTIGGTMKVGVLQLHDSTDVIGTTHIKPIIHNPLTASWSHAKSRWEVDLALTKFSTFYAGDTASIGAFNCVTSGQDSVVTGNGFYVWHNDSVFASGVYMDTLANANGCDSITTLKITFTTSGISTLANSSGVYVYPNPSNGKFNLTIQNNAVVAQNVRVINMLGAEVYNKSVNGNAVIDLSSEENGVYYVIITSQENTIVRRVIKQQ